MRYKYTTNDGLITGIFGLAVLALWVLAIIGWVLNIIKLFATINDPITAMMIFRGVGILAAPLGVVLGYL